MNIVTHSTPLILRAACLLSCFFFTSAACRTKSEPVTVSIRNTGGTPVFVDANGLPFKLLSAEGQPCRLSLGMEGLDCSKCEEECGIIADAVARYIEIPPGKALAVRWEPKLYQRMVFWS